MYIIRSTSEYWSVKPLYFNLSSLKHCWRISKCHIFTTFLTCLTMWFLFLWSNSLCLSFLLFHSLKLICYYFNCIAQYRIAESNCTAIYQNWGIIQSYLIINEDIWLHSWWPYNTTMFNKGTINVSENWSIQLKK